MPLDRDVDERLPPVQREGTSDVSVAYSEFTTTTRIGSGGMATVYEATVADGPVDTVAIKQPDWDDTVDRSAVEAFISEAETWARIDDHPNIGVVYGSGIRPQPWLAVEYIEGDTLAERMPVEDPREALWIGSAVADGIQHAHHRGVAHLDIKPSNVLLEPTDSGTWDRPKIVDWGLATALDVEDAPDSFTLGYEAPEQLSASDGRSVGPLTDIYQLGALVYALLTGHSPNRGDPVRSESVNERPVAPPSEVRDSLPREVDSVVRSALAETPTDRIRTAAQFGEACATCFRELSASTEISGSSPSPEREEAESNRGKGSSESSASSPAPSQTPSTADDGSSSDETTATESEPTTTTAGDDNATGWFKPDAYPEDNRRSIAAALRAETRATASDTDDSLADALREISTRFGTDSLGDRLSIVHSTERDR